MKKIPVFVVLIFALMLSGCGASKEYRELQGEVKIVIADMILLMQRALYADMVNQYFEPSYVDQYGTATVVNDYGFEKNDAFFRMLRASETMQPTVNTQIKLVTYNNTGFPYPLNFKKSGDRWYFIPE